ncbi:MAG: 50S ribosomal protein L20 [Candidatus Margulisiibacteriota bacterium]|nr:MAG: 50S ribosomal protein L20 [Candidatus Margulisbacteria bacterium GWD2_39_127]OGI05478.1 MAG: 50S ribosomal protein L20 [Candidatus Margulisbacteria bacterium GWF2_38_17]OGI08324.1 MAG: 50S ribosomal protein L20 [Candidatus Margulisbacteria bacterium GWE2_39_32]PZM82320.1 MAG: 50S ribosomal protein L20 [Candidatus Margulisiibacteriota bacterium]HAR62934.1 50S ribosomal protein L20 [Candidatus Margulisiibacteriota bacterium]
MVRVKRGFVARRRRKKILNLAKGFRGSMSRLYRIAHQAVTHALVYAYRDRRNKKRQFRQLWIARISAAVKNNGMSYSKFIYELKNKNIKIDRKIMSDIAIFDKDTFSKIVETVKS